MADTTPVQGLSVEEALSKPVEEMVSTGGGTSIPVNGNGDGGSHAVSSSQTTTSPRGDEGEPSDDRDTLLEELRAAREERDTFQGQYKMLLGKLTQMRSTLGDRLRQDAEELDRREGQIESLQSQIQEVTATVSTLQSELVSSNSENERVTRELDSLRTSSQAALDAANKATAEAAAKVVASGDQEQQKSVREAQLHQLTQSCEALKVQSSSWETAFHDAEAKREELERSLEQSRLDRQAFESELTNAKQVAQSESESARNLQLVLEEFQADQEAELQRALGDYQRKYDATATELAEVKERAKWAEKRYTESRDAAEKSKVLEQEVKEKNLLIGKLRHEAVILNEHLTEALRRLNRDQSDTNVDRRLVTNVLLQFLTTPRQDAKRFEMLMLLSTILHWSDEEKEAAGVQRSSVPGSSRFGVGVSSSKSPGRGQRSVTSGQEESFSNLFVEFLLSEADQAKPTSAGPGGGSPSVATSPSRMVSPQTAPAQKASFDSASGDSGPLSPLGGSNKHFGSSRRTGSISALGAGRNGNAATSPTREMKNMRIGAAGPIQEEKEAK